MLFLRKFNENVEEQLCRYIDDDDYHYWRLKKYIKIDDKAIGIFKNQIIKFLDGYPQNFDESKMNYYQYKITFNGNPLYGPGDPNLKISLMQLEDSWYLIEAYFNWAFYTFLCDDIVGIEKLADTMIQKIEDRIRM